MTINLIEPGSLYGDRINQLDFRFAKNFRFGGQRARCWRSTLQRDECESGASPTTTAFMPGGPWLQPNSILTGRLARISAEWSF